MANKPIRKMNESVDDPRELLLSLVDLGSIDADEMLLSCVAEMSDAECKRVLSSLSLPSCTDMECDDEEDTEPSDDMMVEFPEDDAEDAGEEDDVDDVVLNDEDDSDTSDESDDAELEARIRRLENSLRSESMNRNRIRRVSHRKVNR